TIPVHVACRKGQRESTDLDRRSRLEVHAPRVPEETDLVDGGAGSGNVFPAVAVEVGGGHGQGARRHAKILLVDQAIVDRGDVAIVRDPVSVTVLARAGGDLGEVLDPVSVTVGRPRGVGAK